VLEKIAIVFCTAEILITAKPEPPAPPLPQVPVTERLPPPPPPVLLFAEKAAAGEQKPFPPPNGVPSHGAPSE
jgi:hypothetical protein